MKILERHLYLFNCLTAFGRVYVAVSLEHAVRIAPRRTGYYQADSVN
ncbi:MAG: hypothetical protein WAK24_12865 [Candidatus Acidiferrales bacterium]